MKRPPGKEMLDRARDLRREMTPEETLLWGQLRGRRLEGFKFRKQMWLAGYIADFACPEARLVVEADGSQHADDAAYDRAREAAFARLGWRTVRFWNNEIERDLDGVLTSIRAVLLDPSPLRGEGQPRSGRVRACVSVPEMPSPSHPAAPGGPLPLPKWERCR